MTSLKLQIINPSGSIHNFLWNEAPISWADMLHGWQSETFVSAYVAQVLALGYQEFFWEHPAISAADLDRPYEVSILPAYSLEGKPWNHAAFAEHFRTEKKVVIFDNLSGSAKLVVPVPDAQEEVDFGTIARFMRNADDAHLVSFFRTLRLTWLEILEKDLPFKYLSTHGLGVYWLHARFDVRPKYYHTFVYK